ncbi:allatostatin-A receptor-like [Mercenaria mercenaria]|uniref:allatostatin-A receptor-like n=1 Tax=Mercenaria mercenaria TaxID=6596 RepID=UPI001E1DF321|nr:allatostatin-A receptor-like [Mercenaria mercenaria]XP_053393149.1 allatostatin-A receptor-like [Mercenaria mercenaria]
MASTYSPILQNATDLNDSYVNGSMDKLLNDTAVTDYYKFERYVRVIIPIIFGLIVAIGFLGNLLVIVVIIMNQQMRSTTNLLILNLAFADLCFIMFCVPFTAAGYAIPKWPFGEIWCKIVQYLMYVCAYASVYTLVVMSLDRYLAVVHPISSMSVRNQTNTVRILVILWAVILGGHIPLLLDYMVYDYDYYGEFRSVCISKYSTSNNFLMLKVFYGSFFMFGYVLPLSLICVLYGFMLKRLLYGVVPGGSQRAESIRSKKRVTKMVVIVVAIFALCWLPIQVVFMVQNFGHYSDDISYIAVQMVANCLAYMNSCVNPILYAFLSDNFRRSFRKVLCCGSGPYTKFEYERTNIRIERPEKTTPCQKPSTNTSNTSATSTTTLQTYYHNAENGNNKSVNHCTQTEV